MRSKSQSLFHFTKSLDTLKKILANGFWPRYCLEDNSWLNVPSHKFLAYPMVCFCDIPLLRIIDHISFYGNFGLGMSRGWAFKNKLDPVFYATESGFLKDHLRSIYELVADLEIEGIKSEAIKLSIKMQSYIKPYEGKTLVNGELVNKEFYMESEWRYVPEKLKLKLITEEIYSDKVKLDKYNEMSRKHSLTFLPADIRYIFVQKDSYIPELVNFINQELDKYRAVDLKILLSRITSIESLLRDL